MHRRSHAVVVVVACARSFGVVWLLMLRLLPGMLVLLVVCRCFVGAPGRAPLLYEWLLVAVVAGR